jgi:uncharacterized YigZ family protein
MSQSDQYRTLDQPAAGEVYKEKGSKFLGYAYPVSSQEAAENILFLLRKDHPKARHWCYAWKLGIEDDAFRYNDDGEPNNSAGKPIYGQIQSFGLTNVLVVVVRYFGGTKLGVGGLVSAYKSAAKMALEKAVVVERTVDQNISLRFDYEHMDKIMRIIKENDLRVLSQKMEMDCLIYLTIRKNDVSRIVQLVENLRCVKKIEKIN